MVLSSRVAIELLRLASGSVTSLRLPSAASALMTASRIDWTVCRVSSIILGSAASVVRRFS